MSLSKKKIVVIGGGNGSATMIRALKENLDRFDISAVVTVFDSGGSSGRLREEFDTLPPGDILRAVLAMSGDYDYGNFLKPLFYQTRLAGPGKLFKHNLGNLFLTLVAQYAGDFISAVRALEQIIGAVGCVYPATLDRAHLAAELENGDKVYTEAKIDRPEYDKNIRIKKLSLSSAARIYPPAGEAIAAADYIIFSTGSLFSSVIATILPDGFKAAFERFSGKLIYVAGNKYELDGETGPKRMGEALWTLEEYLPRKIDKLIFNTHKLNRRQKEYYAKKRWGVLRYNPEHVKRTSVVGENFEKTAGGLDTKKLGKIFKRELV